MVKQSGKGYAVYSKTGKKLSRTYATKQQANARLREIEWFANKERK